MRSAAARYLGAGPIVEHDHSQPASPRLTSHALERRSERVGRVVVRESERRAWANDDAAPYRKFRVEGHCHQDQPANATQAFAMHPRHDTSGRERAMVEVAHEPSQPHPLRVDLAQGPPLPCTTDYHGSSRWRCDKLGLLPAASVGSPRISRAVARLWGGFSADAVRELLAVAEDSGAPQRERAAAENCARELAYVSCALRRRPAPRRGLADLSTESRRFGRQLLLECECLLQLERTMEARQLLEQAIARAPYDHQLAIGARQRLVAPHGLAQPMTTRNGWRKSTPFTRKQASRHCSSAAMHSAALNNLTGEARSGAIAPGPLISVLIPAYKAESHTALRRKGVLEQTWANLELIIVDDVSPDATFEGCYGPCQSDPRIKVVRQTENRGAYVARNAALALARWRPCVYCDADDWSHPQKLGCSLRSYASSKALATTSDWVRALPHLYFRGSSLTTSSWVTPNLSSLLLEAKLVTRLGGLGRRPHRGRLRLQTQTIASSVRERVRPHSIGRPSFAFALESGGSLTRAGATHMATARHGVRRTYHDAS